MKKRLSVGIGLLLTLLLMVGCVPKKVSDSEQNSDSKYASNSGESENLDYENEEEDNDAEVLLALVDDMPGEDVSDKEAIAFLKQKVEECDEILVDIKDLKPTNKNLSKALYNSENSIELIKKGLETANDLDFDSAKVLFESARKALDKSEDAIEEYTDEINN